LESPLTSGTIIDDSKPEKPYYLEIGIIPLIAENTPTEIIKSGTRIQLPCFSRPGGGTLCARLGTIFITGQLTEDVVIFA
jgi:hypothetical protein